MAPAINTNTCCQVGLVKPCLNGSIQAASLGPPTPAIRPPNPIGERLDRIEAAANPWCDHKGFNSHAPSENGQSRAEAEAEIRTGGRLWVVSHLSVIRRHFAKPPDRLPRRTVE